MRLIENFYKKHPRERRLQDPDYSQRVASLFLNDDISDTPVIVVLSYNASSPINELKNSQTALENTKTLEPG